MVHKAADVEENCIKIKLLSRNFQLREKSGWMAKQERYIQNHLADKQRQRSSMCLNCMDKRKIGELNLHIRIFMRSIIFTTNSWLCVNTER